MELSDIKYIREIDFSLRNFTWTIIGGLMLNVVFFTTTFVVGFSNDNSLLEIIMTIPYALMIATLASVLIFPFLDLREYLIDRVMCRELDWNYKNDYVNKFTPDQLEKVRENYLKLTELNYSNRQIRKRQESFIGQLTGE